MDFYKFRCLFDFYPSFLDECHSTLITETDRQFFGRLAQDSIADYNVREVCPVSDQTLLQFSCLFLIIFIFIIFDSCKKKNRGPVLNLLRSRKQICTGIKDTFTSSRL